MKLVVLSDETAVVDSLQQVVGGQGHQVVGIRGDFPLENLGLPDCDGVVVEEATWNRYASIYRYFQVLEEFAGRPFGLISPRRRAQHLKCRRRLADAFIGRPISAGEAIEAVAQLQRAQTSA